MFLWLGYVGAGLVLVASVQYNSPKHMFCFIRRDVADCPMVFVLPASLRVLHCLQKQGAGGYYGSVSTLLRGC